MRKQLREWALKSYANAVDPANPDYLLWRGHGQALVDAAYVAESFLRAYDQLWMPLDDTTKKRYFEEFTQLRRVDPPYTNWLLFSSTIESFLAKAYQRFVNRSDVRGGGTLGSVASTLFPFPAQWILEFRSYRCILHGN